MTSADKGGTSSEDDPILDQEIHWCQVAQREFLPEKDGGLTTTITFAIAEANGVSPGDLKSPPLYDSVDVDGIEKTFFARNRDKESRQGTGSVEFRYMEFLIKVRSDGWVQVFEPSTSEPGH